MKCNGLAGVCRNVIDLLKKCGFIEIVSIHDLSDHLPEDEVRIISVGAAVPPLLSVVAVPGDQLAGVIDPAVLCTADAAADAPEEGICAGCRVMPVPDVPVLPVCGLAVDRCCVFLCFLVFSLVC